MPEFAEFDPRPARAPRLGDELYVRPAATADIDALADIAFARDGGDWSRHRMQFATQIEERDTGETVEVLAAVAAEGVVGFGRTGYFTPPPDPPPRCIPAGWYLMGVVVRPEYRRRGIGLVLTQARLKRLFERTDRVYYFASAQNPVTIALHATLGFREVARGVVVPGVSFTGGVGILFVVERT